MLRRGIHVGLLAALLALGVSGVASAHAVLVRTEPADGAVLAQAPHEVRFWFSEAVLLNFTSINLVGSDGREVTVSYLRSDPNDPKVLMADLPQLAPNAYRLTWRTMSDDDLHLSTGSIVFGVRQAAELAPTVAGAATPQLSEVALRWLNFLTFAGLIGALALGLLVLPADGTPPAQDSLPASFHISPLRRRLLRVALWSAGLALIVGAGLLFVQSNGDGSALIQVVTQSGYGAHWLMREGWLIVIILILGLHLRRTLLPEASSQVLLAVMAPLIMALVISQTLTSHAAAASDGAFIPVAVEALHLLAASLWVGGLLSLAIVIVPLLRHDPAEKALARSILRRFSLLAASSVAILAVTGLLTIGGQVASLDALLFTFYGQTLLVKTVLVMSVLLIALTNSALVHPWVADRIRRVLHRPTGWTPLPARYLRRALVLEAVGATSVLLLAALLGASQPARGPEFDPPVAQVNDRVPDVSTAAADLLVTFAIRPNHPGQNFVQVGVFNTRRPPPAPIERVTVKLIAPGGNSTTLTAPASANGRYEIPSEAITNPGDWQVSINITRRGLPDAVLNTAWRVTPAVAAARVRPVVFSNRPLMPWTVLFGVLLAAGLSVTLIAVGVRRAMRTTTLTDIPVNAAARSASKE